MSENNDLHDVAPSIEELRQEIDHLDKVIISSIQRRSEISYYVGKIRMSEGGPRLVHNRELQVLEKYGVLGKQGKPIAKLLLELGRGELGKIPKKTNI